MTGEGSSPYQALEARFARLGTLQEAAAILHWDSATLMPPGGATARAEQVATLKVVCHEVLTDAALPDLFGGAGAQNDLDSWQQANLAEMRRRWVHATAVPADLVEALSRACSACEMRWREARPAGDYAAVLPELRRVLDIVREIAAAKAAALGKSPYEALLDEYEPGGSTAAIDRLFDAVAGFLPALIDAALDRQRAAPAPLPLPGPFPIAAQRELGVKLMERLGFDFAHGRLDVSLHPFCGGTPDDVRLTTRYEEADFNRALMGVLHETGHALYERGLPTEWRRQPVGDARGMSIHESQSLLVEMQACRSREFAEFVAPLLREAFAGSGPAWAAENLYRLNTRVQRSLIRVDADEVTYPLHIMLRYELERQLLSGELAVRNLAEAWNAGMEQRLGIRPANDLDGCLQDVHWAVGSFGYFPSYALGTAIAAQLYESLREGLEALDEQLARGEFGGMFEWLRTNVHGLGAKVPVQELLKSATGKPLGAASFVRYVEAKYLESAASSVAA